MPGVSEYPRRLCVRAHAGGGRRRLDVAEAAAASGSCAEGVPWSREQVAGRRRRRRQQVVTRGRQTLALRGLQGLGGVRHSIDVCCRQCESLSDVGWATWDTIGFWGCTVCSSRLWCSVPLAVVLVFLAWHGSTKLKEHNAHQHLTLKVQQKNGTL